MEMLLPCLYAFAACFFIAIVYNIHGKKLIPVALGGAIGWFVYLLCSGLHRQIYEYFFAAIVIAIYSEIMARVNKVPVTIYLIVALIPLVPGGGIYYTMEYCLNGNIPAFEQTGLHTLGIAGALALGILMVSSAVRLIKAVRISAKHNSDFSNRS